ncbi:hypothetical protein TSUD_110910 [Trifolium subterraneum]|uniref:Reverse transcriptase domain-containing protein n=1 Tax=Trifolium subterraneum TaxID=3900 RepID=A0A2Z6LS13_TRISU|nr:hypothetical protein TSUD_110910 [Trifolium subterraneum]
MDAEGFVRSLSVIIARAGGRLGAKAFSNDEMLVRVPWDRLNELDLKGEESLLSDEEVKERREISAHMFSLSRVECSISWQNSRTKWLMEGDVNSKFFHALANSRGRKKLIVILDVNGEQVEGVQGIRTTIFDNFSNHFKSSRISRPDVGNLEFKSISEVEANMLVASFGEEEVRQAVWDCDSFKSPGPDDVNFGFINEFWQDLKADFLRFFHDFHNNSRLVKGLNCTFIVLILKVDAAQKLSDYRPISLVGCVYKVLAKVLSNRLSKVIGSVISDKQSTFVQGRQILDGILIANEVVDEAKSKKKELLMFKVDFEKSYDSVKWSYLLFVMHKMNFPLKWRRWIYECIRSASASVLVNGSPTEEFFFREFGRDLSFRVTHLQFADDTIIFAERSWANIRAIKVILLLFESKSGLKVNFHKSMLVGVNVDASWLEEAFGRTPFNYLRLPIGGNPRRLPFWKPVIDRIKSNLSVWKCRNLSMGVVWSFSKMHVLASGLFSFLLQGSHGCGGLGVRKVKEFNVALLGKWCWRLKTERGGLWRRVLAHKYGEVIGEIEVGGGRKLGNGEDSLFWDDPWLGEGFVLRERFPRLAGLSAEPGISVGALYRRGWGVGGAGWSWRHQLFAWEEELLEECCALFHNIVLQNNASDRWLWRTANSESFSVKEAYLSLTNKVDGSLPRSDMLILFGSKVSL